MTSTLQPIPDDFPDRTVCIVGLGYVGLTLAVAMADAGFVVHGVEVRPEIVHQLRAGRPHLHEPRLADALRGALQRGRLHVWCAVSEAPSEEISCFIITVGTPLDARGVVRSDSIAEASEEVSRHFAPHALVSLRSTVKVGTTRQIVAPILARSGRPFELAFCPERTLAGAALAEMPQLPQVVGAAEARTVDRASSLFGYLTKRVVRVSSLEAAEMVKLVDNSYRDVTFGFANEVARACDTVGVSAAEVIRSANAGYLRTQVPMPGPVGGPCLSKDSHILNQSVSESGIDLDVVAAARRVNERQPMESVTFIKAKLAELGASEPLRVALFGVAFKGSPETNDLRGSMARPFLSELRSRLTVEQVRAYDPVVSGDPMLELGLAVMSTVEEAFEGAHLVVFLNNHASFSSLSLSRLMATMAERALVYDCWNLFDRADIRPPPGRAYVALGAHSQPVASSVRGR